MIIEIGIIVIVIVIFYVYVVYTEDRPTVKITPTIAKKEFFSVTNTDMETARILAKAGIPDGKAKSKANFKKAITKLTKKEIDVLAEIGCYICLDARKTKSSMIDDFIEQIK